MINKFQVPSPLFTQEGWFGFFKDKVFFSYFRCENCNALYNKKFFNELREKANAATRRLKDHEAKLLDEQAAKIKAEIVHLADIAANEGKFKLTWSQPAFIDDRVVQTLLGKLGALGLNPKVEAHTEKWLIIFVSWEK